MRFTVRSLGGKLIISAALTLLLCMALFAVTSWYLLKTFYEHQANSDARAHLASIETSYHTRSSQIIENLSAYANASDYSANNLQSIFLKFGNSLSDLAFVSNKSAVVDVQQDHLLKSALPGTGAVRQALQGKPATALQSIPANDCGAAARSCWFIEYAVPVHSKGEEQNGVLVGIQFISDEFANDLVPDTSWNVVLCESQQVVGTNIHGILLNNDAAKGRLCQPDTVAIIATTQHYLTFSGEAHTADQIPGSPSIAVVDVEPLYNISANPEKALEILLGTGVFYISLGVVVYMYVARTFFIRPIRRLQARISALVEDHGRTAVPASTIDELGMLARSFNLLSESLQTRETESNVITKQMSDLLKMSDVLISTLNLDHLLGEVVSRLGTIMRANNVSLLLYGREMLSPWAVAHWSDSHSNGYMPATSITQQYGAVTVHTDPDGDITMAATTKMIAMPAASPRPVPSSSDKRRAIRPHKLTSQPEPYGLRRPRIPRPALRDLDMILARMALQKQPIGSIILYGNKPREVTGSDTFLLSTAAIQVAMAIQNTLLFVEVKDKNAALERVNNLKSQFLATVTHELLTPLHSIISYGALILEGFVDGELTAEQEEHIQFMVRRAEDLHHLVDDMLDLSKIEADRLEVKVEPLSLESNLVEVVNQLKPMANNKGLYLTLEIDDGLPMALADSYRLRQVVINMVSNALKFTEKGGVTIRCTRLERYDMLRVSVHATAIGISPSALDYIFEAFRQADGSTTRRFGGTGLGLTIARKLVELQGGEVAVESIVGQGSTFSFSLP